MPWLDACIGEVFTTRENKLRRKLFIKLSQEIIEVQISARKFNLIINLKPGDPIKIKGSFEKENNFQIYLVEDRISNENWDVFPDQIGIVDHINKEKGIAHFVVSKKINGIIKLNQVNENLEVGSCVLVKLKKVSQETREPYYSVLKGSLTQQQPKENILKSFSGVIIPKGDVGFINDIFIGANLMQEHYRHATKVSGLAVINYNKQKGSWGWKAISCDD